MQPLASAPLTHSATLRRLLYEAMADLGLDPTQVYRDSLHRPRPPLLVSRLLHDEVPQFWRSLVRATGDVDIGLHLGEVMKPRLLDVVGYLLLASRDLGEALQSFLRFQHILSGGFCAQLREQGEHAWLILDIHYQGYPPLRQQMECLMMLFLKLMAFITDDEFRFLGIEFRHAQPPRLREHRRLFGLTPTFDGEHDAICFPRALLSRPSRTANAGLHAMLCKHAEEELRELRENDLFNRLRYLLGVRLGQTDCSLRACAQSLGLTEGALQRGLAAQGSSFRELREEVCRQRAIDLLGDGVAIREVARRCGFAELSPFYRAFRRWFGVPPERYRRQLGSRTEEG